MGNKLHWTLIPLEQGEANVYYINALGESAYIDKLFLYVFTKCNITSVVFWFRKKVGFKSIVKKEKGIKDWLKVYCSPKQTQRSVDTNRWRSMFALFDANQKYFPASTCYIKCPVWFNVIKLFYYQPKHYWLRINYKIVPLVNYQVHIKAAAI